MVDVLADSSDQVKTGSIGLAVIMISFNEEHNIKAVADNLKGWANEVYLVDSYSTDRTVDVARENGIHVVQRKFSGFGDQWNFALEKLPVKSQWTMKLDPDERLDEALKASIREVIAGRKSGDVVELNRRLWFMGKQLPVKQRLVRAWKTGNCRFSDVTVNEYPLAEGEKVFVEGELQHYDSPDLHHWYDKQNKYSSAEALNVYENKALAEEPRLFGNALQRRMWIKARLNRMPFRSFIVFFYCYVYLGAWRVGRVGLVWSLLRVSVYRMRAYKLLEMQITGNKIKVPARQRGEPHPHVEQFD